MQLTSIWHTAASGKPFAKGLKVASGFTLVATSPVSGPVQEVRLSRTALSAVIGTTG